MRRRVLADQRTTIHGETVNFYNGITGLTAAGLLMSGVLAVGAPSAAQAATAVAPGTAAAVARPATPGGPADVLAVGAALARAKTGKTLWSRDLNTKLAIGSITKMMTAILVIKANDLAKPVTVTPAAVRYVHNHGASSAGLVAGDVLTGQQLLEALLVPSGCDAAFLLERAYAPTAKQFVAEMNAEAVALGMTRTHFSNADGLPVPTEHSTYSTPADLITLGKAAMAFPLIARIVHQKEFKIHPVGATLHAYTWKNTNLLLKGYPGSVGIKTGTTDAAGQSLLFEATRGGATLIGVVLHANGPLIYRRFIMPARMLNWGFARFGLPPERWQPPKTPQPSVLPGS
jgi:serine-type D-Ala-D-Ala carboxypeptidase (penicillin-binding protein 5/6)